MPPSICTHPSTACNSRAQSGGSSGVSVAVSLIVVFRFCDQGRDLRVRVVARLKIRQRWHSRGVQREVQIIHDSKHNALSVDVPPTNIVLQIGEQSRCAARLHKRHERMRGLTCGGIAQMVLPNENALSDFRSRSSSR